MDVVRAHFRPEFLNRLDEIILFHRLAQEHMAPIVDIQVGAGAEAAQGPQDRARPDRRRASAGSAGWATIRSMARGPLKRAVQRYLQDPLAEKILAGEVPDGSTVKIDEGDGALTHGGRLSAHAVGRRGPSGQQSGGQRKRAAGSHRPPLFVSGPRIRT